MSKVEENVLPVYEPINGSEDHVDQSEIANPFHAPPRGHRGWRDYEIVNTNFWLDRTYSKLFFDKDLQDNLTCSYCRGSLFVGPFFYEKENFNNKACGRCVSDPKSAVHTREMLQDHMYEKLLPSLLFTCSHKGCVEMLTYLEVEEHESNCIFKLQTQAAENRDEQTDLSEEDERIRVNNPDNLSLCEALSCDKCGKPLSVFPVISNGVQFICGRCQPPKFGNWTAQMIYFSMERFLQFPCCFSNCSKKLKVDEVDEHYRNCRWSAVFCQLCKRKKLAAEMSIHIRRHHLHECVDRLEVKKQSSLFKLDGEPFMVSIEETHVEQQFFCDVYGLDEKEYDNLRLEIVDKDDDSVLEAVQIQVTMFRREPFYRATDRVQIKRDGRNKNAFLRLVRVVNTEDGVDLDEESSDALECKVCYNYMTRSIFKCENDHPICPACKVRVTSCPMCRGVLGDRRHWDLEYKAVNVKFPCSLQDSNNCNVALTPKSLARHEARCKWRSVFEPEHCPIQGCGSPESVFGSGSHYEEFFSHCAQHHLSRVGNSGSNEIFIWSTENTATATPAHGTLLFFDDEMFHVQFHYDQNARRYILVEQLQVPNERTVPSCNSYKCTLELQKNDTEKECHGTLSEHQPSWTLDLNGEVEDMVHVDLTSSWLEYRVTLEVDT